MPLLLALALAARFAAGVEWIVVLAEGAAADTPLCACVGATDAGPVSRMGLAHAAGATVALEEAGVLPTVPVAAVTSRGCADDADDARGADVADEVAVGAPLDVDFAAVAAVAASAMATPSTEHYRLQSRASTKAASRVAHCKLSKVTEDRVQKYRMQSTEY